MPRTQPSHRTSKANHVNEQQPTGLPVEKSHLATHAGAVLAQTPAQVASAGGIPMGTLSAAVLSRIAYRWLEQDGMPMGTLATAVRDQKPPGLYLREDPDLMEHGTKT